MSDIPYPGVLASPNIVLQRDAPCRKCGYNLKGLAIGGRCPECAMPVGVSIHGDLLRYSDPAFLASLHKGVNLVLWGLIITIGSSIVCAPLMRQAGALSQLLPGVGALMTVVGGWLLTVPDPSGIGEDRYGNPRKIIRVCLAISVIQYAIAFPASMGGALPPAITTMLLVLTFASSISGLVGHFAQLYYLSKLALRIPDIELSNRARFLMWALGISYGVLILLGVLMAMAASSISRGGAGEMFGAAAMLMLGIGVVALIFFVMYLFMLGRLGNRFNEALVQARVVWTWGSAPGGTA